ncbi:MAG: hypothetical protein HY701_06895, partial [Gemmatimonadetes bacterium]|nr:hypothetical protein [Gemmatimonadota bacterium]
MAIKIVTLGALRCYRDGQEIENLPAQRLRCALLVYLAVERDTTRDAVMAVFWPERDVDKARHALSQTLYELRRAFGDDWLQVQGDRLRAMGALDVDVARFTAAVARGELSEALEIYGGPFLESQHLVDSQPFESWADRQGVRLAALHRRARLSRLSDLAGGWDTPAAIECARRWTEIDPLEDEAHHQLIELLAAAGRRSEALAQYDAYARLLAREELEPLDETKALVERIRTGEAGGGVEASAPQTVAAAPAPSVSGPRAFPDTGTIPTSFEVRDAAAALPPGGRRTLRARLAQIPRAAWFALGLVAALIFAARKGPLLQRPEPLESGGREPTGLAVLYLDDLSPDGSQRFLADGLTEDLSAALARFEPLRVISPAGVQPYRGGTATLDSVARALSVDFLVSGSVAVSGNRLRVKVQLTDAASGYVVQDSTLERPFGELFTLQDELVTEITDFLRFRTGSEIRARRTRAGMTSVEAWELVRRAADMRVKHSALRDAGDLEGAATSLVAADSLLARAEVLDPNSIHPILHRGWTTRQHVFLIRRAAGGPSAAGIAKLQEAIRHADRALSVRPGDPEALELRGVLRAQIWGEQDPRDSAGVHLREAAEADLRAAVDADPSRARALSALSAIYQRTGRLAQANVEARRAYVEGLELAEIQEVVLRLFATSFELRRDPEAERWCEEVRRRNAQEWIYADCALRLLGWADQAVPDPERAWQLARLGLESDPPQQR